jgi:hypothetical protein
MMPSFSASIAGRFRGSDRIATDYGPTGCALETGNRLFAEKIIEKVWLDHVKPAIAIHNSDHHDAPLFMVIFHIVHDLPEKSQMSFLCPIAFCATHLSLSVHNRPVD